MINPDILGMRIANTKDSMEALHICSVHGLCAIHVMSVQLIIEDPVAIGTYIYPLNLNLGGTDASEALTGVYMYSSVVRLLRTSTVTIQPGMLLIERAETMLCCWYAVSYVCV